MLRPGWFFTVSADGYFTRTPYDVDVNGPSYADVALSPANIGPLTVNVVDFNDTTRGVPNAAIAVFDGVSSAPIVSGNANEFGVWTSPDFAPGNYSITISASGYLTRSDYLYTHNGMGAVEIGLTPAAQGPITVLVTNYETSAVIPDASVEVHNLETNSVVSMGNTDASGMWTTDSLPVAEYGIDVSAPGFVTRLRYTYFHTGSTAPVEVSLVPAYEGTLIVKVADWDTDAPIAHATVNVIDPDTNISVAMGTTNAAGEWTSAVLAAGTYDVEVSAPGYTARTFTATTAQQPETVSASLVKIVESAVITVKVTDADTGKPVAGASVQLTGPMAIAAVTGTTDANGLWVTHPLRGGSYQFAASKSGYHTRTYDLTVTRDEQIQIAIAEKKDIALTVRVRDQASIRVTGATVSLVNPDTFATVLQGTTGSDGDLVFPAVAQGTYLLEVKKTGYTTYLGDVTLTDDQEFVVTVTQSGTPTNPTDPTGPTDPTDPTSPTNPTDPIDPTDPNDPTDPTNPTDPTGPTGPTNPTDPTDPTDPNDPTDPTGPADPAAPTTPGGSDQQGGDDDPLASSGTTGVNGQDALVNAAGVSTLPVAGSGVAQVNTVMVTGIGLALMLFCAGLAVRKRV